MRRRTRLLLALVAMMTLLSASFLWWQSERSMHQQREQLLAQADQRSLQLSDAMANQVGALISVLDLELRGLRREWARDPTTIDVEAQALLAALPSGFVTHVSVTDAQGYVVYNSRGVPERMFVGDREHFRLLQGSGEDRLVIGKPMYSRVVNEWTFVVSRPLLRRNGRFEGTVQFLVSTDYVARRLAALQLTPKDVVALVHTDGTFMARSRDNASAMGQRVPADRPYLTPGSTEQAGIFHVQGLLDGTPRTYGWRRIPDHGLVVAIGLERASVLEPVEAGLARSQAVTAALALLLLLCGGYIVWLLLRAERSQVALKESEARLKEAQKLARLGSWQLDLHDHRLSWSDEMYRILEVDPDQTPSYQHFIDAVHPDDRALINRTYKVSVEGRAPYEVVHRLLMRDGRVKHVREAGFTQFDNEQAARSVGTVQDITEVHRAEEALRKLNEELEARVAERTRELSMVNRELEAFAYSVSHDLRTPLRTIDGFARVIEEDDGDRLSAQGRGHLRRILGAVHRMGRLTSDLLAMAQISRTELHRETVDLSAMARTVADELARSDVERHVAWHIEDGLKVTADPGLMRVVLENLLGNAWKYTSQVAQARVAFVRSPATAADGVDEFCVRDNGAGFDMTYASQLFEPFKRLHRPQEFEGSGVGLATVHRVIERHGGRVRGEGAVGQGAAFYFSVSAPGR